MQNVILILTIFTLLMKGLFAIAAKTSGADVAQLQNICNLMITTFAFIGLYCQWMWQREQFKLKGEQ